MRVRHCFVMLRCESFFLQPLQWFSPCPFPRRDVLIEWDAAPMNKFFCLYGGAGTRDTQSDGLLSFLFLPHLFLRLFCIFPIFHFFDFPFFHSPPFSLFRVVPYRLGDGAPRGSPLDGT